MFTPKLTCPVCGSKFTPSADNRYTAIKDTGGTGLIAAFGSSETPTYYDAFDCPTCGCQLRPNIRLPKFYREEACDRATEEPEPEEDTADDEH